MDGSIFRLEVTFRDFEPRSVTLGEHSLTSILVVDFFADSRKVEVRGNLFFDQVFVQRLYFLHPTASVRFYSAVKNLLEVITWRFLQYQNWSY